jgi:hypothetical protein
MFQTEVRDSNKAHILYSINFSPKNRNVEKYCRFGQATDDNIVGRMRIACGIPKATNTYPEHAILTAFGRQQSLLKSAHMCIFIRGRKQIVIEILCLFCDFLERKTLEKSISRVSLYAVKVTENDTEENIWIQDGRIHKRADRTVLSYES